MESAGLRSRSKRPPKPPSPNPDSPGRTPPKFTINLSTPPAHRYDHIVPSLLPVLTSADVTSQFNALLAFLLPNSPLTLKAVTFLLQTLLRRVHSDEETAELRGLSRLTGLPMYLLVALNVMLDLLLGCTSGGVRCSDGKGGTKIVHFRTLDWSMDPLRNLVIELDYVTHEGGPVVATTIGYLGYVGILTGVRRGLSLSLNFRPVYSVEKDHGSAGIAVDEHFLTTCNHDLADEEHPDRAVEAAKHTAEGMFDLVENSIERKRDVFEGWQERLNNGWRRRKTGKKEAVEMDEVLELVSLEGISNEMTHYAVVMDPEEGKLVWRRVYDLGELGDPEWVEEDK
ncbi:hypothetical protein OQA88_2585 [Cercophora sp. LCS_1]